MSTNTHATTNDAPKKSFSTKRIFLGLIALAAIGAFAFGLTACKDDNKAQGTGTETIKIGAILPLTGGAAVFGKYNLEATKVSMDILSGHFGLKYRLEIEDSKTSPKDATFAYKKQKIKSGGIQIVATELSSIAMALSPLVSNDNGLLVAVATAEPLHNKTDSIQIYPSANQIHESLTQFLKEKNYIGKVTVYYINDDFGKSVSDKLTKESSQFSCLPFSADTNVPSLLAKEDNKCVFVVGYGNNFLATIRGLQTLGQSQIVIMSPEFAFPEFYNAVDISKENYFFMEFKNYNDLNGLLSPKLGRPVHPLDFLVFGGYLASFSAAKDLLCEGKKISGNSLFQKIAGKTFEIGEYKQSFDAHGTAVYDLVVSPISNLKKRK